MPDTARAAAGGARFFANLGALVASAEVKILLDCSPLEIERVHHLLDEVLEIGGLLVEP
jgi:inorganic pyrophosphatase